MTSTNTTYSIACLKDLLDKLEKQQPLPERTRLLPLPLGWRWRRLGEYADRGDWYCNNTEHTGSPTCRPVSNPYKIDSNHLPVRTQKPREDGCG